MRLLDGRNEIAERLPELIDVFRRFWKVVGKFDLIVAKLGFQRAYGELPALVVLVKDALHADDIVDVELFGGRSYVVPHLCRDLARAIREHHVEVRFASLFWLELFAGHQEAGADDLVLLLCCVADVAVFHGWPCSLRKWSEALIVLHFSF